MQVPMGWLLGVSTNMVKSLQANKKPREQAALRGFKEAVYLDLDNKYKK